MTDSEEFNNVTWDIQDNNNSKTLQESTTLTDPTVLDPLSDMDKTLSQALAKDNSNKLNKVR